MLSRVNLCLSHQVILTSRVDALTFYPEGEEESLGSTLEPLNAGVKRWRPFLQRIQIQLLQPVIYPHLLFCPQAQPEGIPIEKKVLELSRNEEDLSLFHRVISHQPHYSQVKTRSQAHPACKTIGAGSRQRFRSDWGMIVDYIREFLFFLHFNRGCRKKHCKNGGSPCSYSCRGLLNGSTWFAWSKAKTTPSLVTKPRRISRLGTDSPISSL